MKKIFSCSLNNLPIVSVNRVVRFNYKTRTAHPSPEYAKCKQVLTAIFKQYYHGTPGTNKSRYKIKYQFETYKDIGNLTKIVDDALEAAEVIKNDRYILEANAIKKERKRGSFDALEVTVWEI